MIIASDGEVTLEVNENRIIIHNNKEGLPVMQYEELTIDLTKEQIKSLIEELTNAR